MNSGATINRSAQAYTMRSPTGIGAMQDPGRGFASLAKVHLLLQEQTSGYQHLSPIRMS